MLSAALIRDGKPDAAAITAQSASTADIASGLAQQGPAFAAAALLAGMHPDAKAIPALVAGLGHDGFAGQAAAWALAQHNDSEAAVCAAIAAGKLDVRQNGYLALAGLAARGKASAGLAAAMGARIDAELAKGAGAGIADQALRVLAILGAKDTPARIQQIMDGDRFADRFELERLRKAVGDHGRDRESVQLLQKPWQQQFADHLAADPVPTAPVAEAPPVAPPAKAPQQATPKTAAPKQPQQPAVPTTASDEAPFDETNPPPAAQPIDWAAFEASPECTALPAQVKGAAKQLGGMLEQLAAQALQAPLADLTKEELAALLLQVIPQALPQQHVQMALSPPALHAYQAVAKYLQRTGAATHGDQLVQGIKLVRQQMQAQIRKSGILGGPDYSDPDDAPAKASPLKPA